MNITESGDSCGKSEERETRKLAEEARSRPRKASTRSAVHMLPLLLDEDLLFFIIWKYIELFFRFKLFKLFKL
jgi:hypothetical protein